MKIKSFVIVSLSMFFAMTACNSQVENQNQKENVTGCKPVVSTVRFDTMTAKTLPNFKGGDGEVYMKMFTDGEVSDVLHNASWGFCRLSLTRDQYGDRLCARR